MLFKSSKHVRFQFYFFRFPFLGSPLGGDWGKCFSRAQSRSTLASSKSNGKSICFRITEFDEIRIIALSILSLDFSLPGTLRGQFFCVDCYIGTPSLPIKSVTPISDVRLSAFPSFDLREDRQKVDSSNLRLKKVEEVIALTLNNFTVDS